MSLIDIRIGDSPDDKGKRKPGDSTGPKPFLGVKFLCASGQYTRFYKNREGTAYVGRCTKCLKQVRIGIGATGVASRFFEYDCGRSP